MAKEGSQNVRKVREAAAVRQQNAIRDFWMLGAGGGPFAGVYYCLSEHIH